MASQVTADKEPLTYLMNCLRSRDSLNNCIEIREASETLYPEIVTWVNEYLGPETLLTKDELTSYMAIEASKESELILSSHDLSGKMIVDDPEIKEAMDELQKSTVAIEKQTETLRIQQEAVNKISNANTQLGELDELSQNLRYDIADLESKCKAADVRLREEALEILRTGDKFLAGLQKLASDLELGESVSEEPAAHFRDLCARLIKYIVERVRSQLDRVYLEATDGTENSANLMSVGNDVEVMVLQNELESLYTEILPVAQMSVEQQFLERALRLIAAKDLWETDRAHKALDYISNCISALVDQLQVFTAAAEDYQTYRAATTWMINFVRTELDSQHQPSPGTKPGSPVRLRNYTKPLSPIRPRNTRRRSSATSMDEDTNPELQLLRNFGISLPSVQHIDRSLAMNLETILTDRRTRLNGYAKSLQEGSEISIASHLNDARVTLILLKQSLLSETQYGRGRFLDANIEESIMRLDANIEKLKNDVGSVKLDRLKERNIGREELVERWT